MILVLIHSVDAQMFIDLNSQDQIISLFLYLPAYKMLVWLSCSAAVTMFLTFAEPYSVEHYTPELAANSVSVYIFYAVWDSTPPQWEKIMLTPSVVVNHVIWNQLIAISFKPFLFCKRLTKYYHPKRIRWMIILYMPILFNFELFSSFFLIITLKRSTSGFVGWYSKKLDLCF